MNRLIDISGKKFTRLLVNRRLGSDSRKESLWECICDCGETVVVRSSHLRKGKTKSCGCFRRDCIKLTKTKHGCTNSRLYNIWCRMLSRCKDKRNTLSNGQRNCWLGVTVCDAWLEFSNFKVWAESTGYSNSLSIDRERGAKVYSPDTCRWSTRSVQSANRGVSHTKKSTKFLGVYPYNNKSGNFYWLVMVEGVNEYGGPYRTDVEAAVSRNKYILGKDLPHRLNDIEVKR